MHGQHCEESQEQRHMWPGPLLVGPVADSPSIDCFSKDGRKFGVGDCALFQAGNAPPFVGIIRKLSDGNEGSVKLVVNWLYRDGDVKLGKGIYPEAAPNEVFYSFHKDEIPVVSLLHPCKVAFLRKGDELPSGVSSFICRRAYDIANKCLYWLTDQDYTEERQEEVDQLLDRTKHEMEGVVPSQRALSGPTSSQQPPKTEATAFPGQCKGKKRDRTDQTVETCKQERSIKLEDGDLGHSKWECNLKLEDFANIADKDEGLTSMPGVDQLVQAMNQERNETLEKSGDVTSRRTFLAGIVAVTEREDCLTRFVQLGGLPVLDDWLQEAHKGRTADCGSPNEGDKGLEELLLTLLRALDKLPVDLDALKTCMVGKSVNNLRGHRNSEIQRKARKLVDTWKKRVGAEMKLSGESKSGSSSPASWSCKQSAIEVHGTKGRTDGASAKSTAGMKTVTNGSCSGDAKCSLTSVSGYKEPSCMISKDNSVKAHASGTSEALLAIVKEEKSSNSSQSQTNSQSCCSGSLKETRFCKEEVKTSPAVSPGTKTTTTLRSHTHPAKGNSMPSSPQSQESPIGKHCLELKSLVSEKATGSVLFEKGAAESMCAQDLNTQSIIVKIPNRGQSPAQSANGSCLADGGTPASRGSSPGSSERHEPVEGKNKMISTASAVDFPDTGTDAKVGYDIVNGSGETSAVDCLEEKDRSSFTLENADLRSSDRDKRTQTYFNHRNIQTSKSLADDLQVGIGSKVTADPVPAVDCSNASLELPGLDNSDAGIDLLASVAACDGPETEKSFRGVTGNGQADRNDANKESSKQTKHLKKQESKNQEDVSLPMSHENGEVGKKDGLSSRVSAKVLLELGGAEERVVDPGSCSLHVSRESADDCKEPPSISTLQQNPEQRLKDVSTESTLASNDCRIVTDINISAASESKPVARSRQNECGGPKIVNRETTNEETGTVVRVPSDIGNSRSLTVEWQAGAVSNSEKVVEDAKKEATSSPSSLARILSIQEDAKGGFSGSGYYEEDALEVACQVAKEVEQEVERYGKPNAQDVKTVVLCKTEPGQESPICKNANYSWISVGVSDSRVKALDRTTHGTDTLGYSDDNQETVTEKKGEREANKMPSSGKGEEVDQVSCSLSPKKLRPGLEPMLGSVVDGINTEQLKEKAPLDGVQEKSVDGTVCNIQSGEGPTPDQVALLNYAANDGKCSSSDASGRLVFDLNEGFEIHDDTTLPTTTPDVLPDSQSGSSAILSSLAAPVAIVAAAKGAFIPPSNLSRSKSEVGWKGTAATSAFRPAEPRRTTETLQLPVDTACTAATVNGLGKVGKCTRTFDIDLNVADERVMEDAVIASSLRALGSSCQIPVDFANVSCSSGFFVNSSAVKSWPELDLNRVDESEESIGPLMSDSKDAEKVLRSNRNFPLTATRIMRDFDLNDGPVEEAFGEEASLQHSPAKNFVDQTLPVLPGMTSNPEVVNVASWYPAANPPHNMLSLSGSRTELSYPVVAAPTARNVISMGPTLVPYNGDLYRAGAVISSSPSVSYSTTMPATFPYSGFTFGPGFPFTSASYNLSSTPYIASTNSPAFASAPSQLVSAGTVIPQYGRPYLMGITEAPPVDNCASWSRPNLDLNAGPDRGDVDVREEGLNAGQVPAGQLSFQQSGSSGVPLKRREPEGGFDPFRSGSKQMTWR